jgi:hypothetical protein
MIQVRNNMDHEMLEAKDIGLPSRTKKKPFMGFGHLQSGLTQHLIGLVHPLISHILCAWQSFDDISQSFIETLHLITPNTHCVLLLAVRCLMTTGSLQSGLTACWRQMRGMTTTMAWGVQMR